MISQAEARHAVYTLLSLPPVGYGSPIQLLKFISATSARVSPYSHNTVHTYADPVQVAGRVTLRPSKEVVSKYGGVDVTCDLMALFSPEELEKLPGDITSWITTKDQLVYAGKIYDLSLVKPTARYQDEYMLVVVFGTVTLASRGA